MFFLQQRFRNETSIYPRTGGPSIAVWGSPFVRWAYFRMGLILPDMRKFIRRYIPDYETLNRQRWFGWMGHSVRHPRLWHLNRHSVAGAVAIGLITAMIPGPLQMLGAATGCVWFKKNLPVAIACTFVSNPLTILPLYAAAFTLGAWLTGSHEAFIAPPDFSWQHLGDSTTDYWHWIIDLGPALAVGLPLLTAVMAVAGYVAVEVAWRLHVRHLLQQRARRRPSAP